ncbi:hypothetical protein ACIHFE_18290 [Streptomyces sp. NPDC052396]
MNARPPAPCPECRRIKARYYAADKSGDRAAADTWTAAMGRHLREAHP